MKIALVYDVLYPFSIGGVEARNFSLAKHLVLKGHEVHLFGVKMWKGSKEIMVSKKFFVHGVSRYSSKYSFKGQRKVFEPIKYSFFLFFELIKYDFDIIDVSAFPYFPVFSCKLYSLIKRKSIVITWHEVWDDYWKDFGIKGFFGRFIEKVVSKLSKKNLCVSELTAKKLNSIRTKKAYIKVINNWIDIQEIEAVKPLNEKYDLISIGRHLKHKNFDLLLKICSLLKKEFPKLKVLIIGEGPETLNLFKIRKALYLEKNVDILSFTKEEGLIYSYIKSSKIFVLLSELEGFSIVSFEAMACGLPVITLDSERNALSGFIKEGSNGFVCNKSEIDIAHRISQLLKNEKLSSKMKKYCKKFVREYDAEKQMKKIELYYDKIK